MMCTVLSSVMKCTPLTGQRAPLTGRFFHFLVVFLVGDDHRHAACVIQKRFQTFVFILSSK